MIPEIGAGVEPEVEDLPQALDAELGLTAGVDEADDGDALVVERPQEAAGHLADGGQATGTAVTSHRQVVDRDRDLAAGRHRRHVQDEARQENAQMFHAEG